MIVHVGEQVDQVVTDYTEPIPALDFEAPCGLHVYELVGGNKNYLKFDPATRKLTVNTSLHSDVQINTTHTIRAYGSKWPGDYAEQTFQVTIEPCTLST
jgi:hypothetical protein